MIDKGSGFISNNKVEIGLIVMLFASLFIQQVPVLLILVLTFAIQLTRVSLVENTYLLLRGFSVIAGAAFISKGISGIGGGFYYLGFLLLLWGISTKKNNFFVSKENVRPFIILILLFTVSILITSGGDASGDKLYKTVYNGIGAMAAFILLFSNINTLSPRIGLYLLIYGILLLRVAIDSNGIAGPQSLLDFGFMRLQTEAISNANPDAFTISYHFPGYYFLEGLSILLIIKKCSRANLYWFCFIGLLIALYSGARQTIVIAIVIMVLMAFFESQRHKMVFIIPLILSVLYFIVSSSSEIVDLFGGGSLETMSERDIRDILRLSAIEQFLSSPWLGVGFGRFFFNGEYGYYPHNLIFELLCEVGIIGSCVVIFLLFKGIRNMQIVSNGYMYMLLVFFLGAMISGCMFDNIKLFAYIFALPSVKIYNKKNYV